MRPLPAVPDLGERPLVIAFLRANKTAKGVLIIHLAGVFHLCRK